MPEELQSPAFSGADEARLRTALQALPPLAPGHSPLQLLQARLSRKRRTRIARRLAPLAAAATVFAVAVGMLLNPSTAPQIAPQDIALDAADDTTAFLIAQNEVYESALRSAAFNSRPRSARTVLAAAQIEDLIGMVDLQLSATTDRDDAQLLWGQRLSLMQELATVRASNDWSARTASNLDFQNAALRMN